MKWILLINTKAFFDFIEDLVFVEYSPNSQSFSPKRNLWLRP